MDIESLLLLTANDKSFILKIYNQIFSNYRFIVSRVVNTWGPQTRSETNVQKSAETNNKYTPALQERLQNMEQYLGIYDSQPIPADIYARLKALEESILYLESVSPEYFDGGFRFSRQKDDAVVVNQIDERMAELRRKLKSK